MQNEIIRSEESPQSLISLALEKGASMEQLEKLLALKERWDATQANKSFIAAMSNFQKEVPVIEKKKKVNYSSKTGGYVNYKYAELGEIDESIKNAMAANGLTKRWEIKEEGEKIICTCIISHVDGHTEHTSMSSLKDSSGSKNEIQSRASAISYLQRYTLIGALGLTTASEDNDGDGTMIAKKKTDDIPHEEIKTNGNAYVHIAEETNTPFQEEGKWRRKLEVCKTQRNIMDLYTENKLTVDAHPELQKIFKERQDIIAHAKKQTA